MYCLTLTTPNPELVNRVLRKAKVQFRIVRSREAKTLRGAQNPEVAQQIYNEVARGRLHAAVAEEYQVSWHTVLRVAHHPDRYGVDGQPIRRKGLP